LLPAEMLDELTRSAPTISKAYTVILVSITNNWEPLRKKKRK